MIKGKYIRTKETRKKISLLKMGDNNPAKREDVRKKISLALMGRKRNSFSEEHKRKLSLAHIGKKFSEKHKNNLKISWKNEERRNESVAKLLKNTEITPKEKQLLEIIEQNKLPFNYVGDGKVIFNGFCPDFLSKNPKHIIELFGDEHYSKINKERDERKLKAYSSLGYKTLIIWNWELDKNNYKENIANKIKEFIK